MTSGYNGISTSHYPRTDRFADYMLVNGRAEMSEFFVSREPESLDHCPLVVTIW
jgi:hypothetical protein